MIVPLLTYCPLVFSHLNQTQRDKIIRLESRLPKVKTKAAKKGFFFAGAKMFNELPANIRSSETLNIFKKQIDLYL